MLKLKWMGKERKMNYLSLGTSYKNKVERVVVKILFPSPDHLLEEPEPLEKRFNCVSPSESPKVKSYLRLRGL